MRDHNSNLYSNSLLFFIISVSIFFVLPEFVKIFSPGAGVSYFLCAPVVGNLPIQKIPQVLAWVGWSGLELTDTLGKYWNFSLVFLNSKTLFESIYYLYVKRLLQGSSWCIIYVAIATKGPEAFSVVLSFGITSCNLNCNSKSNIRIYLRLLLEFGNLVFISLF